MTEDNKKEKLDSLTWAIDFLREYEKKLMKRALKIVKSRRKDKQHSDIKEED